MMDAETGGIIYVVIYSMSAPYVTELKEKVSGLGYCPARQKKDALVKDAKN